VGKPVTAFLLHLDMAISDGERGRKAAQGEERAFYPLCRFWAFASAFASNLHRGLDLISTSIFDK
jgi:hypothetical protein